MGDKEELQKKLDECFADFKQYMEKSGIESVKLEIQLKDLEARPEKIELASSIQILEVKEKPKK